MALYEQIKKDLVSAMKAKDTLRLSVLRMTKSAITEEEIRGNKELSDDGVITVLTRLVKQRNEAAEAFEKGGNAEKAASERAEIEILKEYLPKALTEDEIRDLVNETIQEVGAKAPTDFAIVMKSVMPKVKGKADGGLVNRIVKESLAG